MDALTIAQVVWAETKDLRVREGGDPITLSTLRRHVAAIAREADKTFSRFEPIPARDDELYGPDVVDCGAAAEAATPDALKKLRVIVWPSADGKTLNKDELKPPAPWDTAAPESMELIGVYRVDDKDIAAFSRSASPTEDTPRFVSLVTGTGLPPDTDVYAPRLTSRPVIDLKTRRIALGLTIATLILFVIGCVWSLSVGSLTRAAQDYFVATLPSGTSCPTQFDVTNTATLYGAPHEWLLTPQGTPGKCLEAWQKAVQAALAAPDRDWWARLRGRLASWTVSDAGRAFSLRMPILLTMLAFVVLLVAAGLGVLGRPLGLFIDQRNRMSLTRIQSGLWLVILFSGLGSYALYNVGFWAEDLNRVRGGLAFVEANAKNDTKLADWSDKLSKLVDYIPKMDTALWALIGISGGTAIASSLIVKPGAPATPGSPTPMVPARRTRVLTNKHPKEAQLSDLIYGETAEDEGVVDSTRLQAIAVTGVLAAIYISLLLEAGERIGGVTAAESVSGGTQVFADMPAVGATFLTLLAVSHGTLIGGKLVAAYKR
jgi:hypothetical protein